MNQTMNDLALLCIGIGIGLCFALIAVMVYGLYSANVQTRRSTAEAHKTIAEWLQKNYTENTKLRLEVTTALSRLDAEQLRASSLAIQRSAKVLGSQVEQLQKVVFAQPPAPPIDWSSPGTGLDTEAEDDARMLQERAERARWNSTGKWSPSDPPADSLANLSEDEKSRRVLEYFERKRAAAAGFPYVSNPLNPPATPPTAGSGAYASLLDEALSRPQPSPPSPDFSGLDTDEGAELVDKGELS